MTTPECICGEINARNCPVHQNNKNNREWDRGAAIEQAKHEDSDGYFGFLSGAEWQFEQDQIALKELERNFKDVKEQLRIATEALADIESSPELTRTLVGVSVQQFARSVVEEIAKTGKGK